MEEQLIGLKEAISGGLLDEVQMKELYDALDKEDKAKEEEYQKLREEVYLINSILDCYGIPKVDNKIKLSTIERVELAMKLKIYA